MRNETLIKELFNFKRCADEAPAGTYEDAKDLNDLIGQTCDDLMANLRERGFKTNNCDLILAVEATIYNYVKLSNPEHTCFPVAEGFGSAMNGPARERVLANTVRDMECLRKLGVIT